MSRSQRGAKRVCPDCDVRFYDMNRTPIVCPGCKAEFAAEVFDKPRRRRPAETRPSRPPPVEKPAEVAPAEVAPAAEAAADEEGGVGTKIVAEAAVADDDSEPDEDEEEAVIEDASELGEDDDDVAEVLGNVERPAEKEER